MAQAKAMDVVGVGEAGNSNLLVAFTSYDELVVFRYYLKTEPY